MNPEQIAAKDDESGHQKALFAWAAMARLRGFNAAFNMDEYARASVGHAVFNPELKWLHAIPNGGNRDPKTAARLKAEGVKPGIPDIFLPVRRPISNLGFYSGLYIELKKLKGGRVSVDQSDFMNFAIGQGFCPCFAYGWRDAAEEIMGYLQRE